MMVYKALALLFILSLVSFFANATNEENDEAKNEVERKKEVESSDEVSKRSTSSAKVAYKTLRVNFLSLSYTTSYYDPAIDLVFVMDNSGSIGQSDFNTQKDFVQKAILHFPISSASTRVAVVTYASHIKLEFALHSCRNTYCLRQKIAKITYTGGATATGPALEYVRSWIIFNRWAGARWHAKKVVYVLTDGQSNKGVSPSIPAAKLKARRVTMFAMGVGSSVTNSELHSIASSPSYKHVFHLSGFTALRQVNSMISGLKG